MSKLKLMDNIYKADLSTFYLFEGVIYRQQNYCIIVENEMRDILFSYT